MPSYGLSTRTQAEHLTRLSDRLARAPALLPAPGAGRALEFLLCASDFALPVAICAKSCRAAEQAIETPNLLKEGARARLATGLAASLLADPEVLDGCITILADPMLNAAETDAFLAHAAHHTILILLTGHAYINSRAEALLESGAAELMGRNVHPTLNENRALVSALGASRVVLAFCDPLLIPAFARAISA